MVTIRSVEVAGATCLALVFSDGARGEVDLSREIEAATTMTAPLSDPSYFARVFLEEGAPTWPNGFDLAPWALYDRLREAGELDVTGRVA
jgi:uncharacterized protein DUF2442